jgi:hypothetical protein
MICDTPSPLNSFLWNQELAQVLTEISKMEQLYDAVIAVPRDWFTVTEIS